MVERVHVHHSGGNDRRFSLYGGMGCAVAFFGVYSNDSGGGCFLWGCFRGCDSAIMF